MEPELVVIDEMHACIRLLCDIGVRNNIQIGGQDGPDES